MYYSKDMHRVTSVADINSVPPASFPAAQSLLLFIIHAGAINELQTTTRTGLKEIELSLTSIPIVAACDFQLRNTRMADGINLDLGGFDKVTLGGRVHGALISGMAPS